ncbi:TIR domain-containing protein [Streptomyces sp. NPDC056165]|uniref:toll/interleukin-1 receptor domain-containing protein n=1 Tax=Streptomyces sp. NPDC056165 TaxID=3345733 RepID=UPI0035D860E3
MSKPGRKSDGPKGQTDAANDLARWLSRITANLTLRDLSERFNSGGRTLWGQYLKGEKLIPPHLLERLVCEVVREPQLRAKERETGLNLLARAERAAQGKPSDRPAMRPSERGSAQEVQRRLADALEGQLKAERALHNASQIVHMLLRMIAWLQGQITAFATERDHALEEVRMEAAQRADAQLGQAEGHLTRTREELDRARRERTEAEEVTVAAQRRTENYRRALAEHDSRNPPQEEDRLSPAMAGMESTEPCLEDYDTALNRIRSALDDQQEDLAELREHVGLEPETDNEDPSPQVILGRAEVVRVVRRTGTDNADVLATADDRAVTHDEPAISISYTGFNSSWAAWIAQELERYGHRAILRRWDPVQDISVETVLLDLLSHAPEQVLLVLDDSLLELGSPARDEWAAALREVMSRHENADRLAAVSTAAQEIPIVDEHLRPVHVRDLDEHQAREQILAQLGLDPTAPPADRCRGAHRFPNNPTAVCRIPQRYSRFTGREAALEELHRALSDSTNDGARLTLRGIGGVGKSQIALEYAHRFSADYDLIWWVSAAHRASAREQLADLASTLSIQRNWAS